jgi:hypothetical protein
LGPLAAPPLVVATPSPRSNNHSSRGLVLTRGMSGAAAVAVDIDVDFDDVEGQVAVVLSRDNGLTLGLEAGFVDKVVESRRRVRECRRVERAG